MKLKRGKQITLNIPGFDCVELIEELGSGGNGHVWLVKPCSSPLIQYYVLKHIRLDPDLADKEKYEYLSRIKREASVNVASEYIIKCLGVSKLEPDNFVLLFPYSPGQNFDEWINENRSRQWSAKKMIFLKILEGVRVLHRAQIMHRDLKPKNVLILKLHETPRIIDFGLAKFRDTESVTEVGTIAGTDAYIAPEVFGWGGIKEVDERCDIYALGIILYELVMGANPWRTNGWNFGDFARYLQCTDDEKKSTYTNILDIDTQFEFDEDPVVPGIIRRSTMFEPVLRIQTVDEMIRMLKSGIPKPRQRWNPLHFLRHSGDTTKIARQALAHEREVQQQKYASQSSAATEVRSREPKTGPSKSGYFVVRNLPEKTTAPPFHFLSDALKTFRKTFNGESRIGMFFLRNSHKLIFIAVVLVLIIAGGLGMKYVYTWWDSHRSLSSTPMPEPRPTATPVHGLEQHEVENLNRMLEVDENPPPTGEPVPTGVPSSETGKEVDPEDLEELLRQQ